MLAQKLLLYLLMHLLGQKYKQTLNLGRQIGIILETHPVCATYRCDHKH